MALLDAGPTLDNEHRLAGLKREIVLNVTRTHEVGEAFGDHDGRRTGGDVAVV
jgi:hypothetical protein